MKLALSSSPLTLFPEGTRSRNSEIGRGRAGSGMVILETWPAVIPVCIDGMDKLLPVGSIFPRLFKRIYVSYGKPVHLTEFKNMERNKETAQAVIDRVMNSIRELQLKIRKMKQ
jgi:1-acyl-sn-glycerol-3-phosphate acyltransferase